MRLLLLCLLLLAWPGLAPAAGPPSFELARLADARPDDDITAVRQPLRRWQPADPAIRRDGGSRWWRLRLADGTAGEAWIVALREPYDARLVAYLPPDYLPQPLYLFDPTLRQPGSRHRLALELPAGTRGLPLYLEVGRLRSQPVPVTAEPREAYLQADLQRVRFSAAMISTMLLLALVGAIYAVALRRWMLLQFCTWILTFAGYQAIMSGEIVGLLAAWPGLLQEVMLLNVLLLGIGQIAGFLFLAQFLGLPQHHPRLARGITLIAWTMAAALACLLFDPRSAAAHIVINLLTLLAAPVLIGCGVARAAAGSRDAWFFLLGWGSVVVMGVLRALGFIRGAGTADWLEYAHPAANAFGALVLVLATARAARYAEREMQAARRLAGVDPLTRLDNRSRFEERLQALQALQALLARSDTGARPLSLLFLDLDHFKAVNDRYGHALGDRYLALLGEVLRRQVRASDLLVRYGGEEFVLVLEGADGRHALVVAEVLREAVQHEGCTVDGQPVALTVSIGLAVHQPGEAAAELLQRADAALYRAKDRGRNRVAVAEDHAEPGPADAMPVVEQGR